MNFEKYATAMTKMQEKSLNEGWLYIFNEGKIEIRHTEQGIFTFNNLEDLVEWLMP